MLKYIKLSFSIPSFSYVMRMHSFIPICTCIHTHSSQSDTHAHHPHNNFSFNLNNNIITFSHSLFFFHVMISFDISLGFTSFCFPGIFLVLSFPTPSLPPLSPPVSPTPHHSIFSLLPSFPFSHIKFQLKYIKTFKKLFFARTSLSAAPRRLFEYCIFIVRGLYTYKKCKTKIK